MAADSGSEFEEALQNPYRDDPQWAPWHADAVDVQVEFIIYMYFFP
jgi:hypothetical protein